MFLATLADMLWGESYCIWQGFGDKNPGLEARFESPKTKGNINIYLSPPLSLSLSLSLSLPIPQTPLVFPLSLVSFHPPLPCLISTQSLRGLQFASCFSRLLVHSPALHHAPRPLSVVLRVASLVHAVLWSRCGAHRAVRMCYSVCLHA